MITIQNVYKTPLVFCHFDFAGFAFLAFLTQLMKTKYQVEI